MACTQGDRQSSPSGDKRAPAAIIRDMLFRAEPGAVVRREEVLFCTVEERHADVSVCLGRIFTESSVSPCHQHP